MLSAHCGAKGHQRGGGLGARGISNPASFKQTHSHLVSSEDSAGNFSDAQISRHLRSNCRSQGTGAVRRRSCEVCMYLVECDAAWKLAGGVCSAFKLAGAAGEAPWHHITLPRTGMA